jgi:hypothetical protein
MGHTRLGSLPDTAPWREVVGLLAEGAEAAQVAAATSEAALLGINLAKGDRGLVDNVLILIRLVQAARADDFAQALDHVGMPVAGPPGFFSLISTFSEAVDHRLKIRGGRTDLSEMAQLAAIETLASKVRGRAGNLFATTPDEIKKAAKGFSTPRGFGELAHEFFSRFTQRFLTYHLGRELSQHVGGNGRFSNPAEHTAFVERLAVHCGEASAIMRDFAGDWFAKNCRDGEIQEAAIAGFVNHSLTKIHDELQHRGRADG